MFLPAIFNAGGLYMEEHINEILQTNKDSEKFSLQLKPEDAKEIIQTRNRVLQRYGRIDLSIEVIKKLARTFSKSPFVNQEEYALTLNELQEVFYYMKNETEDKIGDDKLIAVIEDLYNNSCSGSLQLLSERVENFCEKFRYEGYAEEDFNSGGLTE